MSVVGGIGVVRSGYRGVITAQATKGNILGLNACYTGWGFSVHTGGTGWIVENNAAIGREFSCLLMTLDDMSVSATLFKVGRKDLYNTVVT